MVPIDAVIVYLESNACFAPPHRAPLCQVDSRRLAADKDDLVITPGGPRPRDQVRRVRPGEVLRQNKDGTFSVIPKEDANGPQPKGKKKEKN
jgi:hypothetical protein